MVKKGVFYSCRRSGNVSALMFCAFLLLDFKQYSIRDSMQCTCLRLAYSLHQRFPTWGTCTPRGTFSCPKGTFEVSNRSAIDIYIYFVSNYLYIYQWILFS